ncbi:MAG TPA: hypothetical protein VGN85_01845, partial [Methyloceanibacter sp.]|nr:hypothetical protein [Methyloceanibacter sp.]
MGSACDAVIGEALAWAGVRPGRSSLNLRNDISGTAPRLAIDRALRPRNYLFCLAHFREDPIGLPGTAPASQLSSEAHSFSRVFTGAFFEAFVASLMVKVKKPKGPTSDDLFAHSQEAVKILGDAVKQARV